MLYTPWIGVIYMILPPLHIRTCLTVIKLGALASQAIVPFIPSQHIIQAMNKKTIAKCTKARHETLKPASGENWERVPPTKAVVRPSGF